MMSPLAVGGSDLVVAAVAHQRVGAGAADEEVGPPRRPRACRRRRRRTRERGERDPGRRGIVSPAWPPVTHARRGAAPRRPRRPRRRRRIAGEVDRGVMISGPRAVGVGDPVEPAPPSDLVGAVGAAPMSTDGDSGPRLPSDDVVAGPGRRISVARQVVASRGCRGSGVPTIRSTSLRMLSWSSPGARRWPPSFLVTRIPRLASAVGHRCRCPPRRGSRPWSAAGARRRRTCRRRCGAPRVGMAACRRRSVVAALCRRNALRSQRTTRTRQRHLRADAPSRPTAKSRMPVLVAICTVPPTFLATTEFGCVGALAVPPAGPG